MKLLLFLTLVSLTLCFDLPDKCAHDVKIDDRKYSVNSTLDVGDTVPKETHYDVYGNLFYIVTRDHKDGFRYDAYVLKASEEIPIKIEGLPDGKTYSIAVDKTYTDVYFGTPEGIYRYDYEFCNASLDSSKHVTSDMLFIDKDGNKFVTEHYEGLEQLFVLQGENRIKYNAVDTLSEMAIDDNNNFFFIKEDKLYVLRNDLVDPNYICDVTYEGNAQITVHDNVVYVASQEVLYFHENGVNKMKLLENIPNNVTTITFDKRGDFALGSPGKITIYKKEECYFRD